jgi:hypothetical protein
MLNKIELSSTMQLVQVKMKPIIDYYDDFDDGRKGEISKLVNGLYGRVQAIEFELITAEAAIKKGRSVILQTHADVTVGAADELFAKSSECKSVTTDVSSAVNTQLRAALLQVAGDTGHMPRDGDARVIDIKIDNELNPWPLPGSNKRHVCKHKEFVEKARDRFNEGKPANLIAWLQGGGVAAHENVRRLGMITGSNSTRAVVVRGPYQVSKVRAVTIKVRYDQPFEIENEDKTTKKREFISEIVFQVYYRNNVEVFEAVKLKKYVLEPSNAFKQERTMI